jgi:hypothetical protein
MMLMPSRAQQIGLFVTVTALVILALVRTL